MDKCPKCGAERVFRERSEEYLLDALNCGSFWEKSTGRFVQSEHCKCRVKLTAVTAERDVLAQKLEKATTALRGFLDDHCEPDGAPDEVWPGMCDKCNAGYAALAEAAAGEEKHDDI